jgi:hypothetical protein
MPRSLATLCCLVAVAGTMAMPSRASAGLNMRTGLWEITTTINGAPAGTIQKCYLPKDIINLERSQHGAGPMANPHCQISNYSAAGDTVTFTTTCKEHGATTTSDARLVFEGDRTAGQFRASDGTVTSFYSRRMADCSVSSFGK